MRETSQSYYSENQGYVNNLVFCQHKGSKLQSQKAEKSKCEQRSAAEFWTAKHIRTQQQTQMIRKTLLKHSSSPAGYHRSTAVLRHAANIA